MILYPVTVTIPGDPPTIHKSAKVYAHDGITEVYVWDREANDAALVLSLTGEPEPNGFRQHIVGQVTIAATGGCGCGAPLKRWSPPRPVIA